MTLDTPHHAPSSTLDLFTDQTLTNPYPLYEEIREAGPVVWMTQLDAFAFARYAETRAAARDWEVFSSAHGVSLSRVVNEATGGRSTIASDPPLHDARRRVLRRPLMAAALGNLEPRLRAEANALVDRLVAQGSFDAVTELARHLPVSVISNLVGIPETGRERMLAWAAGTFDAFGPDNERGRAALPVINEMHAYARTQAIPPHLSPDGWAQRLYDSAEQGEIAAELCPSMMSGYLAPSLDTTINGIGNALLLLGQHPEQWQALRDEPALIPNAVNEILRLESPVQHFSRYTTKDHKIGEVQIPAGSRVMLMFGAANRDARRWNDPGRFDVRRERVAEHLAFGFGPHACVGSGLARLEMRIILETLVQRIKTFTIGAPVRAINQTLRGLASLEVTVGGRP